MEVRKKKYLSKAGKGDFSRPWEAKASPTQCPFSSFEGVIASLNN